jgi:hypothetical protein
VAAHPASHLAKAELDAAALTMPGEKAAQGQGAWKTTRSPGLRTQRLIESTQQSVKRLGPSSPRPHLGQLSSEEGFRAEEPRQA